MARALLGVGALAMVALALGSCDDDGAAEGTSAPSTASSAPPTGAASNSVAPTSTAEDASTSSPVEAPPLDVAPFTFTGALDHAPVQPPLAPLPPDSTAAALQLLDSAWTGGFRIDGNDPRVSVHCEAIPKSLHQAASLYYWASTEASAGSEYGLSDGGWFVRVVLTAGSGEGAVFDAQVNVDATTTEGELFEMNEGTRLESGVSMPLLLDVSDDNARVTFSGAAVSLPFNFRLPTELIEPVAFVGTIACPTPLPSLASLSDSG